MRLLKDPRLWLASFAIATVLGFGMTLQVWLSVEIAKRPPFWAARFLQPQLIPWYVWALLTPPLVALVQRMRPSAITYVSLGAASIVVHSIASGFALGWWWAFPSLVPMDPQWHIAYLLRSRTVFGVFMVGLMAVGLRATRREPGARSREPDAPLPTAPDPTTTIALRTKDRVVFAKPEEIDWIEADRDYVIVHTLAKTHRVRARISSFESRLLAHRLIRVSRSAIVNLERVAELQPSGRGEYVIILRDGTRITTGKAYRDRITRAI